jgi:hypothetical protein
VFSFAPSTPTPALTLTASRPHSPTDPGPHTSTPTLHPPKPSNPHHIPRHPNTPPTQTAPPPTPLSPVLCSRCRPPLWLVLPPALPRPLLSPSPLTARSSEPLPLFISPHTLTPSPPLCLSARSGGDTSDGCLAQVPPAALCLGICPCMRTWVRMDGEVLMAMSGNGWKRVDTDGGGQFGMDRVGRGLRAGGLSRSWLGKASC